LSIVLVELVALSGGGGLDCALLRTDLLVLINEFLPSIVLGTTFAWSGAVDLGPGSILQSQLARSTLPVMTPYEFGLSSLVCLLGFGEIRLVLCLVRLLWPLGASISCGRSSGVGHCGRGNRSQTWNRSNWEWKTVYWHIVCLNADVTRSM